jgi:YD repeat-containing protein
MYLRIFSAALAIGALASPVLLAFQSIGYTYDPAGRLTSVTDQPGNSAVYKYDAVGNLLSIATYTATPVATPTYSPTGGVYSSSQTVTISTTTSGASIRYTTDGSIPTSSTGTVYSSAITVSGITLQLCRAFPSRVRFPFRITGPLSCANLQPFGNVGLGRRWLMSYCPKTRVWHG